MTDPIPAILMLPPHGTTPIEKWIAEGRLAAASDLVTRLKGCDRFDPILIIAENPNDEETLAKLGAIPWKRKDGHFHFGEVLASCIHDHQFDRLAYFGGSSAPLLSENDLTSLADRLLAANIPLAITNNLHSTDWALTNEVTPLKSLHERLPSDNPIGWVYAQETDVKVISEPPSAATRLDIDTPMDYAVLFGHPDVGPHLKQFLKSVPEDVVQRVSDLKAVLSSQAKTLVVIGRASAHLWQQLERQTQIWVRLFVEERGMVASRRLARGEVQSLVAMMIGELGPQSFIKKLAKMADAVIWDTRVWMGAEIGWPSAADRFTSDLGRIDEIQNEKLRELTIAIKEADIPILAGGYGVVSGGLYALLETMKAG
jgi:hypothetical protein